jgi:hypothetical protein
MQNIPLTRGHLRTWGLLLLLMQIVLISYHDQGPRTSLGGFENIPCNQWSLVNGECSNNQESFVWPGVSWQNYILMTRGSRKKCRLLRIFIIIGNQMVLDHWFVGWWGWGGLVGVRVHLIWGWKANIHKAQVMNEWFSYFSSWPMLLKPLCVWADKSIFYLKL